MDARKKTESAGRGNSVQGRDRFKVVADNGFLLDSSRTITINLIFTGEVPPDLAALIRDAISAAEAGEGSDSEIAKPARTRVFSARRKKP